MKCWVYVGNLQLFKVVQTFHFLIESTTSKDINYWINEILVSESQTRMTM